MKLTVTRTFIWRGGSRRPGSVIEATPEEAASPFVASHTRPLPDDADTDAPPPMPDNFTNGKLVEPALPLPDARFSRKKASNGKRARDNG